MCEAMKNSGPRRVKYRAGLNHAVDNDHVGHCQSHGRWLRIMLCSKGPNSTCDVALPLELTSGLGRDRGESGGLRGVLVAPARRREKLGRLFIGIVGSGCTRSRIMRLGLVRVRTVDIKGTGGITG